MQSEVAYTDTTGLGAGVSPRAVTSSTTQQPQSTVILSTHIESAGAYGTRTSSVTVDEYGVEVVGAYFNNPSDSLLGAFYINAGTGIYDSIVFNNHDIMVVGNGGNIDITANPQIFTSLREGQILRIFGTDDAATVKLDDGNGLQLAGGASCTLGIYDFIEFESRTIGGSLQWIETGRSDN